MSLTFYQISYDLLVKLFFDVLKSYFDRPGWLTYGEVEEGIGGKGGGGREL